MCAVYINMVKGVRKEWGMYRNVTRKDVWIYRELYGRSQQVFGCVWIVFGILKQAIYGDISLRSVQFGEKKHQEMFRTCREILGLGVSYGFLHFLMVNPWVSDFPSNVALHSSSWNPKACEATGAVSGVSATIQPAGWWFGTMEFYDFSIQLGIVIPTDELHHFPPART